MNVSPTLDEIKKLIEKTNDTGARYIISTSCELLADLETPVSAFYKICNNKPFSFLLESVEGNERVCRHSIIGTEPILLFKNHKGKTVLENKADSTSTELDGNPFVSIKDFLKSITVIAKDSDFLGLAGYLNYENIRWVEPKVKVKDFKELPDAYLMMPGKMVVFDHVLHRVTLIQNAFLTDKSKALEKYNELKEKLNDFFKEFNKPGLYPNLSLEYENKNQVAYSSNYKKEEFKDLVKKAKDHIYKGDIFQVVLSQKLRVEGNYNGLLLYRALRSINPSPYLFYLNYGEFELAGSSPELMVKCKEKDSNKIAAVRPIAGTYPRGKDEKEDKKNIATLLNDPKEKAEHLMLVDLARNDLGRVCKPGSIEVKELMVIEKYSHVLHMVSQVEGILKDDKSGIDLLAACFPAGTLSGAPKVRAMEIINELENSQRGPYGGCLGFFNLNDSLNTCMTIRTFIVYKNHVEIQAGAGIVSDSDPENEYNETLRKGAALLKAISLLG